MIISRQNEKVKKIRSLKEKKFRAENNEYVAYGYKLVLEAVSLKLPIVCIAGTGEMLERIGLKETLPGENNGYGFEVIAVSEEVFSSMTEEVSPQGVLAVIKKPSNELCSPTGDCILLDGISDPGNLGTIIRTAAAADIKELYLADCADAFNPKTVRSAMGGLFRVKVCECDKKTAVSLINKPIIVADMDGENVFTYTKQGDFCLAVGNEANGISDYVKNSAKIKVAVPMSNGIESLNAGVSAGIIMYALKNRKK